MGITSNSLTEEALEKLADAKAQLDSYIKGKKIEGAVLINQHTPGSPAPVNPDLNSIENNIEAHYKNYVYINEHPGAPLTDEQRKMDAIGSSGIRQFLNEEHPDLNRSVTTPTDNYKPREDLKRISSDVLMDSILTNLTNKIAKPADIFTGLGKNNVAFSLDTDEIDRKGKKGEKDGEGQISVVAIRDPYNNKVRGFKVLARAEDFHYSDHSTIETDKLGKADSTGFASVAVVELKVDPKYTGDPGKGVQEYIRDHKDYSLHYYHEHPQALHALPEVRKNYQGYQMDYDSSPQTGELDRKDIPSQLARVRDTEVATKQVMDYVHLSPKTRVNITGSSLGSSNALLAAHYLKNDPELKGYKVGDFSLIEPVGQAEPEKQMASIIVEVKIKNGDTNTSIESEMARISGEFDVFRLPTQSYIQSFELADKPTNNRALGAREFFLPQPPPSPEAANKVTRYSERIIAASIFAAGPIAPAVTAKLLLNHKEIEGDIQGTRTLATSLSVFGDHFDASIARNMYAQPGLLVERDTHPDLILPHDLANDHTVKEKDALAKGIEYAAFRFLSTKQAFELPATEQARQDARLAEKDNPYGMKIVDDIEKSLSIPDTKRKEIAQSFADKKTQQR